MVTKILGKPYARKEGIQKYKNRKDSPFIDLLHEAQEEIIFISTSHEFVAKYYKLLIRELVAKNLSITVMVLNPTSLYARTKESLFDITNVRSLSNLIVQSLKELCILKTRLGENKDKLIIQTYDSNLEFSYILIDPKTENAIIKIEELAGDNPDLRKSYVAYKKDNRCFFQQHLTEITSIKEVKIFDCS